MSNNDEKEFPAPASTASTGGRQNEDAFVWALAFKRVMHYARMNRKVSGSEIPAGHKAGDQIKEPAALRHSRHVLAETRRGDNGGLMAGMWRVRALLSRDDSGGGGFDKSDHGIDIAARLEEWQSARDQRLWKLIVSPEFGERADLERLARDMMARMERDLGSELQWVAVAHHNTEASPRSHRAAGAVHEDGSALRLNRDYIKHGIRNVAEDFCTRQLGHRGTLDAAEAEAAQIAEKEIYISGQSDSERKRVSRTMVTRSG